MNRWIERALNIHPGDLGRGILLSSCLFLTISAYVIGKVARDALFLAQFEAVRLPYADIASGVLVGFLSSRTCAWASGSPSRVFSSKARSSSPSPALFFGSSPCAPIPHGSTLPSISGWASLAF